jgi:GH25 family lysozyme M1 (1,4-beta-N-acetylmuramidase)
MAFIPRLKKPEEGNPYYNTPEKGGYAVGIINGNPVDSGCNVLANCVGYAAGRFNEILSANKFLYFQYAPNPDQWVSVAKLAGLKTGDKPKLGAVLVWHRHVAIVEQINADGSIVTSESGYGCTPPFWTTVRTNKDGNWGGGTDFNFITFIYQPEGGTCMKKGIDISFCQTQVHWEEITADFAIIKAGQRDFTDPMYESHYKGATSRGIPVGAYWYLDALTEENAKKEADCFIQRLKGKKFAYPVFLDLENEAQFKLGKTKVSALIRAFLTRVEAAGYWVGLYGNLSSLTYYTEDDIKKRYSIWLAQWDVQKPTYNGAYGIWQHSVGKADGITGACDLDYCYVDYPTQIKAKGLNGYGKEPTPTPPAPTPKETKEVTLEMDGATWKGTLTKV